MKNYVSDIHYYVQDGERFGDAFVSAMQSVHPEGIFLADNLMTWGKNLNFLRNREFMEAVLSNDPTNVELSLVWRQHTHSVGRHSSAPIYRGTMLKPGVTRGGGKN